MILKKHEAPLGSEPAPSQLEPSQTVSSNSRAELRGELEAAPTPELELELELARLVPTPSSHTKQREPPLHRTTTGTAIKKPISAIESAPRIE